MGQSIKTGQQSHTNHRSSNFNLQQPKSFISFQLLLNIIIDLKNIVNTLEKKN